MRKLDVGPTIDAASWRSVDGGVYARGPKGVYCYCWLIVVVLVQVAGAEEMVFVRAKL